MCVIGVAVTVCVVTTHTEGQVLRPVTPTSTFDAYNNVRPYYAERRDVGSFQNATQRAALRGAQMQNRRENRRGGLSPFSLLQDRLSPVRSGAGALSRFGRTERDSAASPLGTAASAIARRRLLISGSSRNAPIYRALQRGGVGVGGSAVQRSIATAPFVPADRDTPQPSGIETSLHDFLRVKAERDRSKIRSEAWEHFRTGEYLRAAGAFDTATNLDASDHASRVGEMFCHVLLRADHTALAVFRELIQHDKDLFETTLGRTDSPNSVGPFGDPQRALVLENEARVNSNGNQANSDSRAMYLLVLWYLGKTADAQRGAVAMVREHPNSPYAKWPGEMQSVLDRGKPHP